MVAPSPALFRPELAAVVVLDPCKMPPSAPVLEAIAWIGSERLTCDLTTKADGDRRLHHAQQSCILVSEADRLIGILTEWDLVGLSASGRNLAEVVIADVMSAPVVTLRTAEFADASVPLTLFERHHIHHLPLVDDRGDVVGILTDETLRQALHEMPLLRELTVADIITEADENQPMLQAPSTVSFPALAQLMSAHQASAVVIVDELDQSAAATLTESLQLNLDASSFRSAGIVTEREIAQGLALGLDLATIQAQDLITAPLVVVHPETSLWTLQQLMQTRHAVIVANDNGAIVGFVNQAALLNILHPVTFYRLMERYIQTRNRQMEVQNARNQLVSEIAGQIRASLNLQEVLDAAVAGVRSILQCDRVLIQQFQPDWSGVIVAESVGEGWTAALGNLVEDTCFPGNKATLYQDGRIIAIDNVDEANYTDCHLALLQRYQVKANLVTPILVSGQLWGLLIGHHCQDYRSWQKSDLTLLDEIGTQLAIAIQQATTHAQLQTELQALQQSELELRQQRELLRTIIDTMPHKIFIKDWEGRYQLVNRAIAESYHTTVENLIGRLDRDYHPEPSRTDQFLQENRMVIEQQQCLFIPEEASQSMDGQEQWFQWQKHPITLPGVNLPMVLGMGVEITHHKQAESILRQYERVVSATTDGIALLDRNYVYQVVNQVYLDWHEKSREQIVGYSVAELLGETVFQTLVKPRLDRCLAGEIQQYEAWFDYKNGGQRFVSIIYAPYVETDGMIMGVVVTTHDLTSIKRAETQLELQNETLEQLNQALEVRVAERTAALQASEERWQLVLRGTNDAIRDWDVQNQRVFYSSRWKAMRGLAEDAVSDRQEEWLTRIHPDDYGYVMAGIEAHFAGETDFFEMEYRVRHQDGSYFWILDRGQALRDASGQVIRMSGSETNIAQRKQAEAERDRLLSFLQASANEIYVFSAKTLKFEYVNQSALRNLGYSLETMQQMTPLDIKPDFTEATFRPVLQPLLDGSQAQVVFQTWHKRADSSLYAIEVHLQLQEYLGEQFFLAVILDISERKQSEAALQASEVRYRQIVETQTEFVMRSMPDTTITFANTALCQAWGRSPDQIVGLTWREFVTVADLTNLYARIAALSPAHPTFENTSRDYRAKGELGWIQWVNLGLFNEQGELLEIQSVGRDITQLHQTEEALRQSEARFRNAFNSTVVGMALVSPEGRFLKANMALCQYLGYSEAELLTLTFSDVTHPDDVAADRNSANRVLAGEIENYRLEKRFYSKQGQLVWGLLSVSLVRDPQGQPLYFVSQTQDITDRKQAEQENQQLKDRLQFVMSSSPAVLYTCQAEGNFDCTFVSDNIEQVLGYKAAEYLSEPGFWLNRLHPEDAPRVLADLQTLFERGYHTHEYRFRHKNGTYCWVRDELRLIRDAQGHPLEVVGYFADISDRKQVEQQLQSLSERLDLALQAAEIGIWEWDVVNGSLFWDDRMCALYGIRRDDFAGCYEDWQQRVHPDDLANQREIEQQAMRGERSGDTEFRIIRPDGSIRFIRGHSLIRRNALGEPQRVFGLNIDMTDRKLAEQENQQLKERLQFLLSSSPAVIFTCKIEGNYGMTYIGDNVSDVVGYSSADFMSDSGFWADHVHPEDMSDVFDVTSELFKKGQNIHEYRFQHQDGHYLWLREEIRLVRDQQGMPIEIIGYFADISDRKQAELALQSSEARFRQVFDSSVVGMLFANFQGQILDANDRFLEIVGYTKADLEAGLIRWDVMTPPEYAALDQEMIEQFRQMGSLGPREKEYYRKDGSRVAVLIGAAVLPGTPDQVVTVVLDISDRKRLEQAQHRLITILEASTDYISMADAITGHQIWNNAAIKQLCGLESDAAVVRRTETDYHPQWAIERLQQEAVPEAIATGSWLGETALLDAQGQEIPVSELLLAHKSPQGQVEFFSAIMRDMRVRKEYEQRLEQTNAELRRATRLKDEFLANMSHELRTPLNAILGMAEAMQEQVFGEVSERQQTALETIERTGLHLLALINDILDLAKVESGQIELDRKMADVTALCQSSLDLIRPQAFKKQIHLSLQMPVSLPEVWVDERRMRQVLVNLLNNAVKFTPDEGSVMLEVSLPIFQEIGEAESYWLRFAVQDTGIGIAPENLDKLFQPFVQIDSALNRHYEGTGLGLALVKRIVELHGGQVTVTSELDVGSCFAIDLPVIHSERSLMEAQPQDPAFFAENPLDQVPSPLILLVEDNEDNIVTIVSYLEVKGNSLLVARDGMEAIALAESERPDLILMDIQMPEIDGIEAIQRIRALPGFADTPIVALTALVMEGDRERCLAAGATDYLSKPVKLKQLAATIQQLLEDFRE